MLSLLELIPRVAASKSSWFSGTVGSLLGPSSDDHQASALGADMLAVTAVDTVLLGLRGEAEEGRRARE